MSFRIKTGLSALALVLGGIMAPGLALAGAATDFVPHKALYKLSLKGAASSNDVVAVGGKMAFEWRDACDGWAINQRNLMIFESAEGAARAVDSVMTTWEAKDASSFRFIVKKEFGDGSSEDIEGRAERLEDGTAKAEFTMPEETEMTLPAGVMFPTRHTFDLIDRAEAGEKFFSIPIFDGSEYEPASFVSAAIGSKKLPEKSDDPLLSTPYWPIRLAFYGPANGQEVPDYELSVDLHANGVASRMVIHFNDFSVNVDLQRLERIEGGGC